MLVLFLQPAHKSLELDTVHNPFLDKEDYVLQEKVPIPTMMFHQIHLACTPMGPFGHCAVGPK